jgi:hypothetical protein
LKKDKSEIYDDILPALPNVGMHASSAAVKGAPKPRSISGVPTGVPVMTWIIQQQDQTNAITIAPDFFDIILVVNNFVSSKSNQKQIKADKRQDDNLSRVHLPGLDRGKRKVVSRCSFR